MSTHSAELATFLGQISNLNRARVVGAGYAPHKPVLALTLVDAIDIGLVTDNRFELSPELIALFQTNWASLVDSSRFKNAIGLPFRHLIFDGFWNLYAGGRPLSPPELGENTSIKFLSGIADEGRLTDSVWKLLLDPAVRRLIKDRILELYFPDVDYALEPAVLSKSISDWLERDTRALIAQSEAPFRVRKRAATEQDVGAFVRHRLFPKVVRGLYAESCAVCRLDTRIVPAGSVIDAAHIVPFAESHNDDPRNGVALCKNHHWGFDSGWFGFSDDYHVIVAPYFGDQHRFITPGASLLLPEEAGLAPAAAALRWHRKNKLLGWGGR